MGNSFGMLFRITTFGESHGGAVGVIIDGCPPQLEITEDDIQNELDRRKPGQSKLVTQRRETDQVKILSGVYEGKTLGTPICLVVQNEDARSNAYDDIKDKFRPSHADFTYQMKYGIRDWRGGGRSSARETVGRVAAGAVAKKLLKDKFGVNILGWVHRVKDIINTILPGEVTFEMVEANPTRCPDINASAKIEEAITQIRREGDSLGGAVMCKAVGVPAGWGEPVFDKLEAELAKAMLSIPACCGFEIGDGFAGTYLTGSTHNDEFYKTDDGLVKTRTNNSGGIQGGISNGMELYFSAGFKPTATIMREQNTVDMTGKETIIKVKGRHDPCVLPRAVPVVEAMTALVLADHAMRQKAQNG